MGGRGLCCCAPDHGRPDYVLQSDRVEAEKVQKPQGWKREKKRDSGEKKKSEKDGRPRRQDEPMGEKARGQSDNWDAQSEGGQSARSDVSRSSSLSSGRLSQMTKQQRTEAKKLVQAFTKEMVRGKDLHVMLPTGKTVTAQASLSLALDTFKISAGGKV